MPKGKTMNYFLKCTFVAIVHCAIVSIVSAAPIAQNHSQPFTGNGQRSVNQTRDEVAALPASPDVAPQRSGFYSASSASGASSQPYSTFYRQSSSQSDVYNYPATGPPRVAGGLGSNFSLFRNSAAARPTNQMSFGSNTSTGNLGPRIQTYSQTPVYNINPYASPVSQPTQIAGSRSPVEQQRSSTISQTRSIPTPSSQFTTAQQAQAQAIQLARLAQAQQQQAQQTLAQAQQSQARAAQLAQASQPTIAFRQAAYVQPTLGLRGPQIRPVQTCGCEIGYRWTETSFRMPAQNADLGTGLGVQSVTLQNMPVGTYLGTGVVGQPTAYRDGQPVRNLFRYITP